MQENMDPLFDVKAFRSALGTFLTGITVVTTVDAEDIPRGFTANSFTSVSLEPPLVLVCIGKGASTYEAFQSAGHFCINILSEEQKNISSRFSSRTAERFSTVNWLPGACGSPVLQDVSAWFECKMHQQVDAGDHLVLIGRVVDFAQSSVNPLGYCRGAYVTPSLMQSLLDSAFTSQLRVGVILESNGALLLHKNEAGGLGLLTASSLGSRDDPSSLLGRAERLGLKFSLSFLFSVFEDEVGGKNRVSVYYRGILEETAGLDGSLVLATEDRIPWERIVDDNEVRMLRRFIREAQDKVFSVYSGGNQLTTPLAISG